MWLFFASAALIGARCQEVRSLATPAVVLLLGRWMTCSLIIFNDVGLDARPGELGPIVSRL